MSANPLMTMWRHWKRRRHSSAFFQAGWGPRFHGVYGSYDVAMAAVRAPKRAGYDHQQVTEVNFENMCRVVPWDYAVMYWLSKLLPGHRALLDAGGHMGTKYRAWRPYLPEIEGRVWTVWDVPAMVADGTRRAVAEGLHNLRFTSKLEEVSEEHDLFLGSGLLQYVDRPFHDLLASMRALPRTLVLNKVAVTDGPTYFTLENLGYSAVPYQIRNTNAFLESLERLGYRVRDRWDIPSIAHEIPHYPEVGTSASIGAVLELA